MEVVFEQDAAGKRLASSLISRKTRSGRHSNTAARSSAACAIHANNCSMEVGSDSVEAAKSYFFDTSSWGEFCDVTLTLKQAHQSDSGGWIKIDDYDADKPFGTS